MNRRADVAGAGEGHVDAELVEQSHFRGLCLEFKGLRVSPFRGRTRERHFPPDAEGSLVREQREHLLELEHSQGVASISYQA